MTHSQPSNSTDTDPAIDFMSLLGRCLGNFKILERVLVTFRDTGWSDLNQLEAAIERSDYQVVVDISHRFKGAASNVSATAFTKLLMQAEQFGHERDHFELTRILGELRSEWEAIRRYVQVFAPATNALTLDSPTSTNEISETRHACAGC